MAKRNVLAAIAAVGIAGPAMAESRTLELPSFTGIDISSGIDAVVTLGGDQSVIAESPRAEALDELKIEVRNGVLTAWIEFNLLDAIFRFGPGREVKLTIAAPSLDRAAASSGAYVEVAGLSGPSASLSASSGADLQISAAVIERAEISVSSGASMSLAGTCQSADIDVSSGADMDGRGLECTDVEIDASSGASAVVFATGALRANASSGADIEVLGNPVSVEDETSSGGDITVQD